jgi:O-antigen/teichoic acid export membrane protein
MIDSTATQPARPALSATHPDSLTLKRRAARGGAMLLGVRLGLQFVTAIVTIVVARFLQPFDYGVMTAGAILLDLADRLTEIGLGRALVRKPDLNEDDLAEAYTICSLLSWVSYALLFLLAGPAAVYFRDPRLTTYLRVAGLAVLLIPFRTIPASIIQHQMRLERLSVIQMASTLLQAAVLLPLAVGGFGYWSLVVAALAARLTEAVLLGAATGWWPRLRRPGAASGYLIRFGLHTSGSGLLYHLYSNADYAILGRLGGLVVLGYYTLAFNLVTLPVSRLTANLNQVAFPTFSRLQHDPERMWGWYLRLVGLIGLVGLPVMVGMALVAGDAIPLVLGAKWRPAVVPFQIMSLAGTTMLIATSLPPLFGVINRPDLNFKYSAACALVLPPAFYLLGRAYGATGVALAWALVYPMIACGLVVATRSLTGLGLRKFLVVLAPSLAGLAAMVATVGLVKCGLGGEASPLRLALSIAAGILSYTPIAWWLGRRTVIADLRTLLGELRTVWRPSAGVSSPVTFPDPRTEP